MATQFFGTRVKRREDPQLIQGTAHYTDDLKYTGLLHAAFVRSPHAHAKINAIDTEQATNAPGVVAVYTGQDLQGHVDPIPTAWLLPDSDLKTPAYPPLAIDKVRYVGEAVAVVIADDRYRAQDAAELVKVDYETLPAVVDQEKALQDDAPAQVHDDAPNNRAYHWQIGGDGIDDAFSQADRTLGFRVINQRLVPNAIEPRGCVAQYNPGNGQLTLRLTSQNPHIHRLLLSGVLGVPEHKLRITTPEIGGGFGSKIAVYPGEAVVAFAAMTLGKPVKWMETRRENFLTNTHGRDHITDVDAAVRDDGKVLGLKVRTYANMGAYLSTAAPGVPTWLYGLMLSGCYDIPAVHGEVFGAFTNTTPTDAYRGAGRPEATYLVERLMDQVAGELDQDPVEVRRTNFIRKDQFPHPVATGVTYDSGDYEGSLAKCLEMLGYEDFRSQQAQARQDGRYLGVGFSTYVEICGLGPSQTVGATGFQGGLWDSSIVRVHPSGTVTAMTGTNPHGQGEETTFAQMLADRFGVGIDDVDIVHGDTDRIPMGMGTYGSRTTAVGGVALYQAAEKIVQKATKLAAHLLEAREEDVQFDSGEFSVQGSPDQSVSFGDVALQAYLAWDLPEGMEPGLEAESFYDPSNFVFPFGAHACVVDVDPETGETTIRRYVAVDDCGHVINPLIVDGQIHGGIAQGVAQALYEFAFYDDNGQLLTASLMDYAVPKSIQMPHFETDQTVTPSPVNPMGVKGVGEAGTIASTAAVVNAVVDALRPMGITHIDMPLTPERVWQAIRAAEGR